MHLRLPSSKLYAAGTSVEFTFGIQNLTPANVLGSHCRRMLSSVSDARLIAQNDIECLQEWDFTQRFL